MDTWIDHADEVLEERTAEQRPGTHDMKTYSQRLETALEKGARVAHRWTTQTITSAHLMYHHNRHHRACRHGLRTGARHIFFATNAFWQTTSALYFATQLGSGISAPYIVKHERKPCQRRPWLDPEREMMRLPNKTIEGSAKVMQAVEESLALPTQICVIVVALLGKPSGAGERLVTLTGCFHTIFMVGYKNETRFWDDEFHGWWDDAAKGNSALQSGLRRRVYVATLSGTASSGQPAVCVFSELEKFYDTVYLHKLIGLPLERNFPKRLLFVAMEAYLSERTLRAGGNGGAKHTAHK